MDFSRRTAGVLLPVTSLPGAHPCGGLGQDSRRFIDQLAQAGASTWQLLPLGPTRRLDDHSPYSATCSFSLATDLLTPEDIYDVLGLDRAATQNSAAPPSVSTTSHEADRDRAHHRAQRALDSAWEAARRDPLRMEAMAAFCAREQAWLHDAARFAALSESHDHAPWWMWPRPVRVREPLALEEVDTTHRESMLRTKFGQFVAHEVWSATRAHAAARGVRIMGDLPIYVHADGPDVWSQPDLFDVDPRGGPTHYAGVPPDAFSSTGQLWRNPTYRWDASAASGHDWWRRRVARHMALFDDLRLDHFRGFSAYWRVTIPAEDATSGRWVQGPGVEFLAPIVDSFGAERFLAEDLGLIDEAVESLRLTLKLPTTRVLQFATEDDDPPRHAPHAWPARSVAYSGTHDNATLSTWLDGLNDDARRELERRVHLAKGSCSRDALLAKVLDSAAALVVLPLPDLLAMRAEGRINRPGVDRGNWTLRLTDAQVQAALVDGLAPALSQCGRRSEFHDQ